MDGLGVDFLATVPGNGFARPKLGDSVLELPGPGFTESLIKYTYLSVCFASTHFLVCARTVPSEMSTHYEMLAKHTAGNACLARTH